MDFIGLAQIIAGILAFVVLTLIIAKFFTDEASSHRISNTIIILLLAEILCNEIVTEDYRHQIELQYEIIEIQNKHLELDE